MLEKWNFVKTNRGILFASLFLYIWFQVQIQLVSANKSDYTKSEHLEVLSLRYFGTGNGPKRRVFDKYPLTRHDETWLIFDEYMPFSNQDSLIEIESMMYSSDESFDGTKPALPPRAKGVNQVYNSQNSKRTRYSSNIH